VDGAGEGVSCQQNAGERAFSPWGLFRGIVNFGTAQYGTVCSGLPFKMLYLKGIPSHRAHGVQGVECSNHSVPTIYFNDLGHFRKGWPFSCARFLRDF
jgi:hypothetical protein